MDNIFIYYFQYKTFSDIEGKDSIMKKLKIYLLQIVYYIGNKKQMTAVTRSNHIMVVVEIKKFL